MSKLKDIKYKTCIVSAPSSTANLGPGYDVFGLGLNALEDIVALEVIKKKDNPNNIIIKINGEECNNIPTDPEFNSSGKVAKKIISDYDLFNYNCTIDITKNIPAGYGMGSSAASAVATAIAFNKIFELNIEDTKLLNYAAEGELASAGVKHYDNIGGSYFGDFVIVRNYPNLEFIRIRPPEDLIMVVCVPLIEVPKKKTEVARKALPEEVPLKKIVYNTSNACTIVAGFFKKDLRMICKGIDDCIIEPARQNLIPGFTQVKEESIKAGALAFTISGAGPSTIAFLDSKITGMQVSQAMSKVYKKLDIKCKTFICNPSKGAKVISLK